MTDLAAIKTEDMPEGVRKRTIKSHEFIFNHNNAVVEFRGQDLQPAEVVINKR